MARKRFHQIILIASFAPFCWLAMMAVHESGHVLAAWLTGGAVTKVVLHPLAISRTDVLPNPRPGVVVWAGPLVGSVLPGAIWCVFHTVRMRGVFLARFFAGFCLIANGSYISFGSIGGIGDSGEMLRHGSPIWLLWLFGLITIPTGLFLWHRLGPRFGVGRDADIVDPHVAYVSLTLLIITVMVEFVLSPRS